MDVPEFQEALLVAMERKWHWAWSAFTGGMVSAELLHLHLEQEYAVYVRDFPVLVAGAYLQCPIPEVRRLLAENIYEEETGGLSGGRPHPELFLDYPAGLGMDLGRFEQIEFLPAAERYRCFLDRCSQQMGWEIAAGVTVIFLEGTRYERGEVDPQAQRRPAPPLEEHPLVKHYGLSLERLSLTRAHRQIEGDHRAAAWEMMRKHISPESRAEVVKHVERAVDLWRCYRDEVASACGIGRDGEGNPCPTSTAA